MDKETKALIDFYGNNISNLEKENKELKQKDYDHFAYLKRIDNLEKENKQLKRMLNIKEKLDKKEIPYRWNFEYMFDMREENTLLQQQLKQKDYVNGSK